MPFTYGESPYGSDLPPWRGYVEATADVTAPEGGTPDGGSTAQSSPQTTADGAILADGGSTAQATGDVQAPADVAGDTVLVVAASAPTTADAATAPNGNGVAMYHADLSQGADTALNANGIAASRQDILGDGAVYAHSNPMVQSSFGIRVSVETDSVSAKSEAPPIFEPESLGLAPLANSWESDVLEAELKELFMQLFEDEIRVDERYVNVMGVPHLGPRELVESSLAADGLSIYRGSTVGAGAGAYLLRAWRAHNPKRGLHLLKTYLQLLWPNVWTADQMWQAKASPYPTVLVKEEDADRSTHYRTSRIHVTLPARATTGADLNSISSGLRAATPARFVLELAIVTDERFEMAIVGAGHRGVVGASFEGTMA